MSALWSTAAPYLCTYALSAAAKCFKNVVGRLQVLHKCIAELYTVRRIAYAREKWRHICLPDRLQYIYDCCKMKFLKLGSTTSSGFSLHKTDLALSVGSIGYLLQCCQ